MGFGPGATSPQPPHHEVLHDTRASVRESVRGILEHAVSDTARRAMVAMSEAELSAESSRENQTRPTPFKIWPYAVEPEASSDDTNAQPNHDSIGAEENLLLTEDADDAARSWVSNPNCDSLDKSVPESSRVSSQHANFTLELERSTNEEFESRGAIGDVGELRESEVETGIGQRNGDRVARVDCGLLSMHLIDDISLIHFNQPQPKVEHPQQNWPPLASSLVPRR